jgi:DNA-directed RNA polymerase omega subunit
MEFPMSIESKFRYILVAAKRAHELQAGSKARVQSLSNKLIVIAQQEVMAGFVPFKALPFPGDNHAKAIKAR